MKRKKQPAPRKKAAARRSATPKRKVVKPVPEGYPVVTPYLCVNGARKAIDFYVKFFGARARMCMDAPGGNGTLEDPWGHAWSVASRSSE